MKTFPKERLHFVGCISKLLVVMYRYLVGVRPQFRTPFFGLEIIIQPIFDEEKLWVFDQTDLKDAYTLLLLQNANVEKLLGSENDKVDLELQRLISDQFQTKMELHSWVIQSIIQVRDLLKFRICYCTQ